MELTSAVSQRSDTYSTYEASKNILGEFLFPSVCRMLQSFPPFKCTDFVKCVRELWITL